MFGVAVATAILSGALIVGDSISGSLRSLSLERIGNIDVALINNRFFDEKLADKIGTSVKATGEQHLAPVILVTGNARNNQSQTTAANVNFVGADARFFSLFPKTEAQTPLDSLSRKAGSNRIISVVINQTLRQKLNVDIGDRIQIGLQQQSGIHRESLFGDKNTEQVIQSQRARVVGIIPDDGIGRFGLNAMQSTPPNTFISLADLQSILAQPGKVNALFGNVENSDKAKQSLDLALVEHLSLADYGLSISNKSGTFVLQSDAFVINANLDSIARNTASEMRAKQMAVYTYLANEVRNDSRKMPYSTIAALDVAESRYFGGLITQSNDTLQRIPENAIVLNEWATADLDPQIGDSLALSYFITGSAAGLDTGETRLKYHGEVKIAGLGAKPYLTPDFPGINDAPRIAEWRPPFPVDLSTVRTKDEKYWEKYRALPKGFVSSGTGERLWANRFGKLTALWLRPENEATANFEQEFNKTLLKNIKPETENFVFQDIQKQLVTGSSAATDFNSLFIGFSLFLIISSALLIGLLFRLFVENRSREIGVRLAMGFTPAKIQKNLLTETMWSAVSGGVLGCALGVGYAAFLIYGLKTIWANATGTQLLSLHVNSLSFVVGFCGATLVAAIAIWRTLRKISHQSPVSLVNNGIFDRSATTGRRQPQKVTTVTFIFALSIIACVVFGILADPRQQPIYFFITGVLMLAGGVYGLNVGLQIWHRKRRQSERAFSLIEVGIRNNLRRSGGSMLSVGLVASAVFLIVAVSANRKDYQQDTVEKKSGVGGFSLIAESSLPVFQSLQNSAGLFDLGFSDRESQLLQNSDIVSLRLLPGEDASCLNLYKPEKPRILGVPADFVSRGGFSFQSAQNDAENPWQLLNQPLENGVIPAIGDANSVQWILHSGLGQDYQITTFSGKTLSLRFVALLNTSIFQSEILIAEDTFQKLFPEIAGYQYFLLNPAAAKQDSVRIAIESALTDYGVDVVSTTKKLAEFQRVENTYLSVFQILGGFGLLLGTIGLGIVLVRNVLERRGEFATMRAFGFRQQLLRKMLVTEMLMQVICGMIIGVLAALVAIIPQLLARFDQVPWLNLGFTLISIVAVAGIVSVVAAFRALKIPLLPALRSEL